MRADKRYTYKKGDQISSEIWRTMPDAKQSLVIVDREECTFCKASLPFYARLTSAANRAGVEVVSISSDQQAGHKRYLEENHVQVDRVVQLTDTPLRVSATPTLLILDKEKKVVGVWVGQLDAKDEGKVFRMLAAGS